MQNKYIKIIIQGIQSDTFCVYVDKIYIFRHSVSGFKDVLQLQLINLPLAQFVDSVQTRWFEYL